MLRRRVKDGGTPPSSHALRPKNPFFFYQRPRFEPPWHSDGCEAHFFLSASSWLRTRAFRSTGFVGTAPYVFSFLQEIRSLHRFSELSPKSEDSESKAEHQLTFANQRKSMHYPVLNMCSLPLFLSKNGQKDSCRTRKEEKQRPPYWKRSWYAVLASHVVSTKTAVQPQRSRRPGSGARICSPPNPMWHAIQPA